MVPYRIAGWQILCREVLPEQVVDLRSEDAFRRGHLEGAVNIPYERFQEEAPRRLDKRRSVMVVDPGGARAAEMVAWLRGMGYDAGFLDGGMARWTGPLVH